MSLLDFFTDQAQPIPPTWGKTSRGDDPGLLSRAFQALTNPPRAAINAADLDQQLLSRPGLFAPAAAASIPSAWPGQPAPPVALPQANPQAPPPTLPPATRAATVPGQIVPGLLSYPPQESIPSPMPLQQSEQPQTVPDALVAAGVPRAKAQAMADYVAAPARYAQPTDTPGLLQRLSRFAKDNNNMLLGMASGLAGAPSFGTGLGRGFAGAAEGQKTDLYLQGINQTVEALVAKGVPRNEAQAIAMNPTMLKATIGRYWGAPQFKQTQIGQENIVFDPTTGTYSRPREVAPEPKAGSVKTINGVEYKYLGNKQWVQKQ